MSEIQPYATTPVCIKCGSKTVSKTYCGPGIDRYGNYAKESPECLKWICAECFYEWKTQTKDKRDECECVVRRGE